MVPKLCMGFLVTKKIGGKKKLVGPVPPYGRCFKLFFKKVGKLIRIFSIFLAPPPDTCGACYYHFERSVQACWRGL
jgi:hypothetical protein